MNPLFFLFALLGAGGLSSGGGGKSAETTTVKFTSTLPDEPAEPEEDVTEDTPPPPPAPPVEIADETPDAPEQSGDGGSGAETAPVTADGTVEVMTGRVTTLDPSGDDIDSIRIVDGVDHGTVTVNPDGTFALVLTQTNFTGPQSFTYEATDSSGATTLHEIGLNVIPGAQAGGWGTGESHYMLATDADDRVIVEHGDVHTKVYISGADSAYTLADIARIEGMSVDQVTGSWLAGHGGYGQSEDMALAEDAGMKLWGAVTPRGSETSNWLLLESGHEYGDLGRILTRDTHGEDELHPLYIGAWGEGDKPVVTTQFMQFQESSSNLVVQGIEFSGGVFFLDNSNVIFDHITSTGAEMAVQYSDGITIRGSDFIDAFYDESKDGGDWDLHADRTSGLYANSVDGLLVENSLFDHAGWAEGYLFDGSADGGQPPSMWSHNIYLGATITDVTMRDTITMRASSYGAQIRSGGFVEDNVFLDNNAGFVTVGGDYKDAGPVGQYSLITDNLVTSAAHKDSEIIGAYSQGLLDYSEMGSLVDNIVTHLADPNNPEEYQEKHWINESLANSGAYYDDTIVYNWLGSYADRFPEKYADTDINTDGLDTSVLDQTTIQLFTAQLLGKPDATISDLADYLRAQSDGAFDDLVDADLIIAFFQDGFGLTPDLRGDATTLRFVPSDLGEGVRWDNRLNWDTEDLPGTQNGDSVDLGGNHVVFGTNATIDELALSDGALNVYGGRLDVTGGITDDGHLNVEGAGQAWIGGHSGDDTLDIDVLGGRFANTGDMGNTDLDVTGGQAILATGGAEYDVASGRTLAIFEAAAKVGFDGDDGDMAILDIHEGATLTLGSSDGEMASIEEFRSGAFGDAPNVQSGIDLGGATLKLDLTGLTAGQAGSFTLMDADEIVGLVDAATLEIGGLGGRDANIVIDYVSDSVTLELTEGGTGAIDISTVGDERQSDHNALWTTLTADQGLAENLPLPEEEELLDVA